MEIGHPSVVRAPLSKFDAIYMFARFHLLRLHKTETRTSPGQGEYYQFTVSVSFRFAAT